MSCSLAQESGDLVAGGAGSAHVDRDAQRIPGEDALAPRRSPRRGRRGPGSRRSAARSIFSDAIVSRQQLAAGDHVLAPGGVERGGQQGVRAGRLDQGHRAVDDPSVDQVGAEVEDRRLGQAAAELVDRVEDDVGAAGQRVRRQLVGEGEVRAPRLVDDERHARGRVRPRPARRCRRRRRSRWGRSAKAATASGSSSMRRGEGVGRQAVGDPELVVDHRAPRTSAAGR